MTPRFRAASGVEVYETTTDSGGWSWAWEERRGFLTVLMEAVYVPGRARWVRYLGVGRGPRTAQDIDWPAVESVDDAREVVRERAGT